MTGKTAILPQTTPKKVINNSATFYSSTPFSLQQFPFPPVRPPPPASHATLSNPFLHPLSPAIPLPLIGRKSTPHGTNFTTLSNPFSDPLRPFFRPTPTLFPVLSDTFSGHLRHFFRPFSTPFPHQIKGAYKVHKEYIRSWSNQLLINYILTIYVLYIKIGV